MPLETELRVVFAERARERAYQLARAFNRRVEVRGYTRDWPKTMARLRAANRAHRLATRLDPIPADRNVTRLFRNVHEAAGEVERSLPKVRVALRSVH